MAMLRKYHHFVFYDFVSEVLEHRGIYGGECPVVFAHLAQLIIQTLLYLKIIISAWAAATDHLF